MHDAVSSISDKVDDSVGRLGHATMTQELDQSFELEPGGSVTVKNTNGSIQVRAGDGNQVLLRATKRARSAEDLEAMEINIDPGAERIQIETGLPRGIRNASIAYDLTVPRGARVETVTVNGSIKINRTSNETKARSVNGSVTINEAEGNVWAKTVNGSLRVHLTDLEGSTDHSLQTVNGSLKLFMPGTASGTFRASTVNGSIKTDFELEVRKDKLGRHRSINDSIGGGGPAFALSTVNGSIQILEN